MKLTPRMRKVIRSSKIRQRKGCNKLRKLIRCVVFLPILYLLLERVLLFPFEDSNLSAYLDVEKVAVTTTIKKKEEILAPADSVLSSTATPEENRKSLEALTQPFRITGDSCPAGAKKITGYHHLEAPTAAKAGIKEPTSLRRKIPKIVHQQGTSRCISSALYDLNEDWKNQLSTDNDDGESWSIYFHTEDAITRFFRAIIVLQGEERYSTHSHLSRIGKEFPHLGQIIRNCVEDRSLSKRLLWRFLCLYIYGGMYIDLELALPRTYDGNVKTIVRDNYDTVLLWATIDQPEDNNSQAEVGINPTIMAVSPGHPLMYYAVQHALLLVITDGYLGENDDNEFDKSAQNSAISFVLKQALADFLQDQNQNSQSAYQGKDSNSNGNKSSKSKTYYGTGNASVTILDSSHTTETAASELEFFEIAELLVKGKRASPIGRIGGKRGTNLDKSRGTTSSCLSKSLADILATLASQ